HGGDDTQPTLTLSFSSHAYEEQEAMDGAFKLHG
ncbi:hypothetical protein A2U01_0113631, partial [Trifolium medium]|nr:hypothetical protein [Trifolium medium]